MAGIIYKLWNTKTGEAYYGQTRHVGKKGTHFTDENIEKALRIRLLEHNRDKERYNDKLSKAFRRYGLGAFRIKAVKLCPDDELNKWEQYYIKKYDTYEHGYNCNRGGGASTDREMQTEVDEEREREAAERRRVQRAKKKAREERAKKED